MTHLLLTLALLALAGCEKPNTWPWRRHPTITNEHARRTPPSGEVAWREGLR